MAMEVGLARLALTSPAMTGKSLAMTAACIRRLSLANFRSYHAAQIELGRPGRWC